jgi:hypothetical protein
MPGMFGVYLQLIVPAMPLYDAHFGRFSLFMMSTLVAYEIYKVAVKYRNSLEIKLRRGGELCPKIRTTDLIFFFPNF